MTNSFALFSAICILLFSICILSSPAFAVPETTAVRVTDVTTSSFSIVWMTDVAANPSVEVYADIAMQQRFSDGLTIAPMPGSSKAVQAAQIKGIMKVQVSGALPATTYYIRTVTTDPTNTAAVGYSPVQTVTTASATPLYRTINGPPLAFANDLVAFPVYIQPADVSPEPGLGDLVILEAQGAVNPMSAFVGDGALTSEGVLDLNNLFGADGTNLGVSGNERVTLTVYRSGGLSTLTHYRRAPQNSAMVSIVGLLKGFFADINLDGNVDDQDFALFKVQYKTAPNDATYNPDYDFVDDPEGKVDVREFSKFSREYGRTNVQ